MPELMHRHQLIESRACDLELSDQDVDLLRKIGQRMVSSLGWWGVPENADSDRAASVIQVESLTAQRYRVRFLNMVGVVRLADSELYIDPKIPAEHFFYLAQRSTGSPRHDDSAVQVDTGSALPEVLARWCLDAAEALLRQGLRLDYQEMDDELSAVRGQIIPLHTTLELLRGRPVAICRFDELSEDTPLNRVIRAACQYLATLPIVGEHTRARARRVAFRFNCSALRSTDLALKPDRLARGYTRAWTLATMVLRGSAISLSAGHAQGTAFLIRTPELVEEGLRMLIAQALPDVRIAKRRLMLTPSALSVNPDLTFNDDRAVGDVKYRYFSGDWHRSDLYQVVSFATAFRATDGIVVGFSSAGSLETPPSVRLGDVGVRALAWEARPGLAPDWSANQFAQTVQMWWAHIESALAAD